MKPEIKIYYCNDYSDATFIIQNMNWKPLKNDNSFYMPLELNGLEYNLIFKFRLRKIKLEYTETNSSLSENSINRMFNIQIYSQAHPIQFFDYQDDSTFPMFEFGDEIGVETLSDEEEDNLS